MQNINYSSIFAPISTKHLPSQWLGRHYTQKFKVKTITSNRRAASSPGEFSEKISKVFQNIFGAKENFYPDINKSGGGGMSNEINHFLSKDAPSWEELAKMVEKKQIEINYQKPDLETGPANSKALKRTFGKNEPIRIKLYRDSSAWCPYCQKVWIQLEEKEIPYEIEKINMSCYGSKPESFYKINPRGLLPVMELDGKNYIESAVIAMLLEDEFPNNKPLLPERGTELRKYAESLLRLEREAFSAWLNWLCGPIERESAKLAFIKILNIIDKDLNTTPGAYFLGEDISLIDIVFSPFLERMDASLTYYKGFRMRGEGKWLGIERWFIAMESRPTYLATRSDYYTHAHTLPPQLGGINMTAGGEPFSKMIDGVTADLWRLPLPPLNNTSFEPYSPGEMPVLDTYLAGQRLVENHEVVVKFGLRATGSPGVPSVRAPLSDPNAISNMDNFEQADMAFRHVANALINGTENSKFSVSPTPADGMLRSEGVIPALEYLRDRVGVPRDLPFPVARQLRAHLNWAIDIIQGRL